MTTARKVGGWSAAAVASLVTALVVGAERIETAYARWRVSLSEQTEFAERRRHAVDRDVLHFIVLQTPDGLVEVKVYGSGCLIGDGEDRGTVLPSRQHRALALADAAQLGATRLAGWGGAPCRPANGQCAIPPGHPAWDWEESVGQAPDGVAVYDLVWNHGCRLRARWVGRWEYLGWVCCVH